MKNSIDVAISFDTTGSMYPCLTQVRRNVSKLTTQLFRDIPNIRIAIMAHGDYCDGSDILTMLDFSSDVDAVSRFVNNVKSTYGGDPDEAYEFVLNRARTLSWTSDTNKALVMIGDCGPHKVGYRYDSIANNLDWKNEAKLLREAGINIYPVQALGRSQYSWFYNGLSEISGQPVLPLEQFSEVNDLLLALCYSRAGKLEIFEKHLEKRGGVSYNVVRTIDRLAGRKTKSRRKVSSAHKNMSRFQVLTVDKDCDIKSFVENNGLLFLKGRGFYELTKSVKVQAYKQVIAQSLDTGEVFEGDEARRLLGIPVGMDAKVTRITNRYRGFIQSTSVNRKLLAGTSFLYEVDYTR